MSSSHLFLIGYRGSGKSTVAKLLAPRIGIELVDTDQLIVKKAGITISEIFATHGEPAFRELETEMIRQVCSTPNSLVVSLGGGAPIQEPNQSFLEKHGKTVYFRASVDTLWKRISSDSNSKTLRPNLTSNGGKQEVKNVLEYRSPIYESCADHIIDVDSLTPSEIVQQIVDWLNSQQTTPIPELT